MQLPWAVATATIPPAHAPVHFAVRPSARASGGQRSGVVVGRHRRVTAGLKGVGGAARRTNATTATARAWSQASGRSVEFSYAACNHHLKCPAGGSVEIELGMSRTLVSCRAVYIKKPVCLASTSSLAVTNWESKRPASRPAGRRFPWRPSACCDATDW
jgi:hypothetical protein